jgi:hypothetical protein
MPRLTPAESDRVALVAGPYDLPSFELGERVWCLARRDYVEVEGRSPWPWSVAPGGKRHTIVTAELARAITLESVAAVAHHWRVGRCTVTRWRKALGIPRFNRGTTELWRRQWPQRLGTAGARKGGEAMAAKRRARLD